jgi:DNA-binding transcriptional LysR family regulator
MSNSLPQNLNLNHLPVFAAIAETKSLTAAARSLGSDKTRVSRVLRELENNLNVELVYRTTRDLRLTEAGLIFYEHCKRFLSDVTEATHQIAGKGDEVSGHIRLTGAHGIASAVFPQIIKEFRQLYPHVTFEILLTQQLMNLVKEGIDIAFRVGSLADSAYKAKKIGLCHFAFAVTPNFFSSREPLHKVEDLRTCPTIALPSFDGKPLLVKKGSEHATVKLDSAIVCNSPSVILDLTLKDLGVGFCRNIFVAIISKQVS